MAALTENVKRERYFARRSAACQLALMLAFGAAGIALQHAGGSVASKLHVFALLHLCAFGFRGFSTLLLALQPDIEAGARGVRASLQSIRVAQQTADFRVPGYLAALMLGAHVAVPFFTPYMLRDLRFDYATYAGLTAIPIVIKALIFPFLHPLSERFGMRAVLSWSGAVVVVLPALWVVFRDVHGLAFVQALSGLGWGGVEYASFQLLLVSARADCRVEFLSLASTMTSSAQLAGGLGGGYLRTHHGFSYHALFMLSTFGRGLALTWMVPSLPAKIARGLPRLFLRVISVRPALGTVQRPIVGDAPRPPESEDASAQPIRGA
jgi:hypothetical protein